jgi:hypothetical protein
MVDAVIDWNVLDEERVDSLQTTDVVPILIRERSALVVGVDAAVGAKVVLGNVGVELVELEYLLPL